MLEIPVAHKLIRGIVDALGWQQAGEGYGVGAHAGHGLKVFGVQKQAHHFVMPVIKPEQRAYAHVVEPALEHAAVHGFGMPFVIGLRPAHVHELIGRLVVCFLEQDVRAEPGFFQPAVVFRRGGGDVHVHASYGAVAQLCRVYGAHALQDIVDGAVFVVLAGFQEQALVAERFERQHLFAQLFLGKLPPRGLVGCVEPAVAAVVDAVVRKVERREHDDAAPVDALLDAPRKGVYLSPYVLVLSVEESGGLPVAEPAAKPRLFEYAVQRVPVGSALLSFLQGFADLGVIDEFIGVPRRRIIHGLPPKQRSTQYNRFIFVTAISSSQ